MLLEVLPVLVNSAGVSELLELAELAELPLLLKLGVLPEFADLLVFLVEFTLEVLFAGSILRIFLLVLFRAPELRVFKVPLLLPS